MSGSCALPAARLDVSGLGPGALRVTEAREGRSVVSAAVVALGRRTVVFDTLESATAGVGLRTLAEEHGPVALVVLSHRHGDHLGGLDAFADVPVLGSEATCAAAGRGAVLDGTLALREGARTLRVIACGAAHTEGDLALLVEDAGILLVGDLVVAGIHPRLRHGDLDGWLRALERLAALGPARVLPGHGDTGGTELLTAVRGYLEGLRDGSGAAIPGCADVHVHGANVHALAAGAAR